MSAPKHFLDLDRLPAETLRRVLALGTEFKAGRGPKAPLAGCSWALIFEKPSTRTRVSFEVAITDLGGSAVVMGEADSQIGRGETVADTARVLSRYVDGIMIRTNTPAKLAEMAAHATVPVINGLTDESHPCQLMADVMTFEEHKGPIAGRTIAWVGDGNNVAASWIHAAERFGFALRLACPAELRPAKRLLDWARERKAKVELLEHAADAVAGADAVVTDTWVSMGQRDATRRRSLLEPYRVDEALMAKASPDALFLHCLPAHRGEEVSEGVIDGPRSVVWDEAENRLHAQKGILAWCLS